MENNINRELLEEKILASLQSLDKLLFSVCDKNVVLGFRNLIIREGYKRSFRDVEDRAVRIYNIMDSIASKAEQGLSTIEESELKQNYIELKNLLRDCEIDKNDAIKMIKSLDLKELEDLNVQIMVYNIIHDLEAVFNISKQALASGYPSYVVSAHLHISPNMPRSRFLV